LLFDQQPGLIPCGDVVNATSDIDAKMSKRDIMHEVLRFKAKA
jgi:hypothetical protein